MTHVDFYILQDTQAQACPLFACKLTEKAYKKGHQVFINTQSDQQLRHLDDLLWTFRAGSFLPQIPPTDFPAQALACAFYLEGGIRGVEIGTLMFGGQDPATHDERIAPLELLRLAIPRRTYTQSHVDYVLEVAAAVRERKDSLRGLRIVEESPHLRHFTAKLEPL